MTVFIGSCNRVILASEDRVRQVEEFIQMARENGLAGIAVTDHDYSWNTTEAPPRNAQELIREETPRAGRFQPPGLNGPLPRHLTEIEQV